MCCNGTGGSVALRGELIKDKLRCICVYLCVMQSKTVLNLVIHLHDMVWGGCRGSPWRNGAEAEAACRMT